MKAKRVSKGMIFKFIGKILLPSISYGAFTDSSEAYHDYEEMDKRIAQFCIELFDSKTTEKEMLDFLTRPKANGGC